MARKMQKEDISRVDEVVSPLGGRDTLLSYFNEAQRLLSQRLQGSQKEGGSDRFVPSMGTEAEAIALLHQAEQEFGVGFEEELEIVHIIFALSFLYLNPEFAKRNQAKEVLKQVCTILNQAGFPLSAYLYDLQITLT